MPNSNGYGQIFLLLTAIGLILLGASGKLKQVIDVFKGGGSTPNTPNGNANATSTNGSQPQVSIPNIAQPGNAADKAGSGWGYIDPGSTIGAGAIRGGNNVG